MFIIHIITYVPEGVKDNNLDCYIEVKMFFYFTKNLPES